MTLHALWVPLFDELAEPRQVVDLAVRAEGRGWDGFFVWDHVRWHEPVSAAADPWVVMAAIAHATEAIRLGPMVTPVSRRRPAKLARETATLDQLSGGRLTMGVGLGSDRFGGEFSRLGEEERDAVRAAMTDEALQILRTAWRGEAVRHYGPRYVVDDVTFLPRPVQRPSIPVWIAGFPGKQRPMRRAAAHDGYFPVNLDSVEQLAEAVELVRSYRASDGSSFDVAVEIQPGTDPAPYEAAGATWCLTGFGPGATADQVRGTLDDGPPTGAPVVQQGR